MDDIAARPLSSDHNTHVPSPAIHFGLPPLVEHGRVIGDFLLWDNWSASERMMGIRRWFLYAENRYGPLDSWPSQFKEEWVLKKTLGPIAVENLRDSTRKKTEAGCRAISYLGRVMEGFLGEDTSLWRDLYLQSHQYMTKLVTAVVSLELLLKQAMEEVE